MSIKRLPPLNALRVFEVAARHMSFSKAAEELHITPGAVSQQIKSLEDVLGVALFTRINRGLLLTDEGQLMLPDLREGFAKLHSAVDTLSSHQQKRPLIVTLAPVFASQWLIPRLERFYQAYPHIEVRIDAMLRVVNFLQEDVDLGIRYSDQSDLTGLTAIPLAHEEIIPVCSPRLLNAAPALKTLADLRSHTLLHSKPGNSSQIWMDWGHWLTTVGAEALLDIADHGPEFSLNSMAIQAAVAGQGVALANSFLVSDDLAIGRLVQPFSLSIVSNYQYYLIYLPQSAENPRIQAFQQWLLAEVGGGN